MTQNKFLFPAIAVIALALLFPVYWSAHFLSMSAGGSKALIQDLAGLNPSDLVFLLIGVLHVYTYFSLKKFLNERHAFSGADIPLILLIATVSVYVFGSLVSDTIMHIFGGQIYFPSESSLVNGNTAALIISTIVFGGLNIALGFILLTQSREFLGTLKTFAIVQIIQGIFELTVIFSFVTIVIFPLALIILAILFIREPEVLEVI